MKKTFNKEAFLVAMLLVIFLIVSLKVQSQNANVKEIEGRFMKQARENIEKYRKGDVSIQFKTKEGKGINNAKVEVVQKTHDFLFGCTVGGFTNTDNPAREELIKRRFLQIFNFAVFGVYWTSYESQQGMPNWQRMLPSLEWCKTNGVTTKGHPLVWVNKSGYPQWLRNYTVEDREDLLKARVINTVAAFKGKIDIWDVTNESIHMQTWTMADDPANLFKRQPRPPISEVADYVEKAIRWAYSANPDATLIVNEYSTLANKNDRARLDTLLRELARRKTPLSNVGIQAHVPHEEWFTPEEVWKTFDTYAKYSHSIHITEYIPQSSGKEITGGWRTGTWTLEAQRDFAEQFYMLCFGHPAVVSINWWGLSDRNIWLKGGGTIDEEYNPKPVYTMLDSLINKEWKTRISISPDKNGTIVFRGFFGEYDLKLTTANGKVHTYPLHVRKDEENKRVFVLSE